MRLAAGPISDLTVADGRIVTAAAGAEEIVTLAVDDLTEARRIPAGEPSMVVVAGDHAFAAVASAAYDAIAVIDLSSGAVRATYPLDSTVTALCAGPGGRWVYVGRTGEGGVDVAVIDTRRSDRIYAVFRAAGDDTVITGLRVDASGRRLCVALSDAHGSRLVVTDLETGQVRRAVDLGASIRGFELGLDSMAYVLTSDLDSRGRLQAVDLAAGAVAGSVAVGDTPTHLTLSPDCTRGYVVDHHDVLVVDLEALAVVDTITPAARPSCVATGFDRLYVADCAGGLSIYPVSAPAPMLYPPAVAPRPVVALEARELQSVGA